MIYSSSVLEILGSSTLSGTISFLRSNWFQVPGSCAITQWMKVQHPYRFQLASKTSYFSCTIDCFQYARRRLKIVKTYQNIHMMPSCSKRTTCLQPFLLFNSLNLTCATRLVTRFGIMANFSDCGKHCSDPYCKQQDHGSISPGFHTVQDAAWDNLSGWEWFWLSQIESFSQYLYDSNWVLHGLVFGQNDIGMGHATWISHNIGGGLHPELRAISHAISITKPLDCGYDWYTIDPISQHFIDPYSHGAMSVTSWFEFITCITTIHLYSHFP